MNKEDSQTAFKKEYSAFPGIKTQTPMDLNLTENKHGVKNQVTDIKTSDPTDVLSTIGAALLDTATIDLTYDPNSEPKTISAETRGVTTHFTAGGHHFNFVRGILTNITDVSTSPSVSPSSSISPSESSSVSPSASDSPSASPSLSPSKSPSKSPSLSPSISPSVSPT